VPRISAIVANWNGAARLDRLLDSLEQQTERAWEVIVVDNASVDQSEQIAHSHGATFISLDRNYGFAYAVNRGIERSGGEALAILNNDITLAPDFLARLGGALAEHQFTSPKIVKAADPARLDGTFDLTTRGFCSWRAGHGSTSDASMWNQPRLISSAPLTAALFRRSVFGTVGLLDEQFGSYLEDIDFGLRCALKGVRGYYEPTAVAQHEGSATLGGEWNAASVRLIARNQVLLARKYGAGLSWPVFAGQSLWGASAIKHRTGLAWMQGKIEGYRLDVASKSAENETANLSRILRSQEQEIQSLLAESGAHHQRYWSTYFALTGGAR